MPNQRIIPARAGFTHYQPPHQCRPADHPRSRGVYTDLRGLEGSPGGSSPLARGLRVSRRVRPAELGIIPARAGFTRR